MNGLRNSLRMNLRVCQPPNPQMERTCQSVTALARTRARASPFCHAAHLERYAARAAPHSHLAGS
jgi:hypothetical protein